ncbi:hypothetical protein CIT292_06568 [Citrobacter youngae ATCC 29220]|uniref:Uncharacterized protein n=1 Tax=Citrobacter youngae ATCC 29220 TaxID=500640 RepID=D4B7P5_9ENTR|nr:hypothetical protein CIT292_06568 [Citrobacter youngae ATCC 29220]
MGLLSRYTGMKSLFNALKPAAWISVPVRHNSIRQPRSERTGGDIARLKRQLAV